MQEIAIIISMLVMGIFGTPTTELGSIVGQQADAQIMQSNTGIIVLTNTGTAEGVEESASIIQENEGVIAIDSTAVQPNEGEITPSAGAAIGQSNDALISGENTPLDAGVNQSNEGAILTEGSTETGANIQQSNDAAVMAEASEGTEELTAPEESEEENAREVTAVNVEQHNTAIVDIVNTQEDSPDDGIDNVDQQTLLLVTMDVTGSYSEAGDTFETRVVVRNIGEHPAVNVNMALNGIPDGWLVDPEDQMHTLPVLGVNESHELLFTIQRDEVDSTIVAWAKGDNTLLATSERVKIPVNPIVLGALSMSMLGSAAIYLRRRKKE